MTRPAAPTATAPDQLAARLREHLRAVTETSSPTFHEGERARLVEGLWRAAGLEPALDETGNVVAEVPGGSGGRVVLAAHLDTVFPHGTDVRIRTQHDGRWAAPGVGDNSASLAVLTVLAEELARGAVTRRPRLTLAATVGEEGLGDLRGAKALVQGVGRDASAFIAIDGHLGTVVHRAVGSKRIEAVFTSPGGHSWGDYGSPSALHAAADAVHALGRIDVPREPRSSLNVGVFSGGSAVNAIAAEARFTLDLRSVDAATLASLEADARRRIRSRARRHGVGVEVHEVGDRPAASGGNEALVEAARTALAAIGIEARCTASSTDANAAMAEGIPAICFGVYRGGDAHRLGEWCDPASLEQGLQACVVLIEALAPD